MAVFKLFASEDEALLVIQAYNDEDGEQGEVEMRVMTICMPPRRWRMVIRESIANFKLLGGEDEALLVRRDAQWGRCGRMPWYTMTNTKGRIKSKSMHATKAVDKVRWTRYGIAGRVEYLLYLETWTSHCGELDFEGDGLAGESSQKSAYLHADGEW